MYLNRFIIKLYVNYDKNKERKERKKNSTTTTNETYNGPMRDASKMTEVTITTFNNIVIHSSAC